MPRPSAHLSIGAGQEREHDYKAADHGGYQRHHKTASYRRTHAATVSLAVTPFPLLRLCGCMPLVASFVVGLTSCHRQGFMSPLVQADLSLRILRANKHEEGDVVFRRACKLELEG